MADTHSDAHHGFGRYVVVYLIIAVLFACSFLASFSGTMGDFRVWLSLVIAGVQAVLLATVFMHLKDSDKVTLLTVMASLFWLAILFVFLLTDYLTRHIAVI